MVPGVLHLQPPVVLDLTSDLAEVRLQVPMGVLQRVQLLDVFIDESYLLAQPLCLDLLPDPLYLHAYLLKGTILQLLPLRLLDGLFLRQLLVHELLLLVK